MPAISRRKFLHQTTAMLGAAAMAGTALPVRSRAEETQARLPRLKVAPDLVLRQAAGLRPFRPSGFVVKAEPFGDKTLIHNYGHGGCYIAFAPTRNAAVFVSINKFDFTAGNDIGNFANDLLAAITPR